MKRAFSLVELLVVIGIIAILTSVLLVSFSGSTESARAVKCMANMRTLAQAARGGGAAGSGEIMDISVSGTSPTTVYYESKGWISGDSRNFYGTWYGDLNCFGTTSKHDEIPLIGLFETDYEKAQFAITNGWMYAKVGKRRDVYVCPSHAKKLSGKRRPLWSYVMRTGTREDDEHAPERTLVLAELPFEKDLSGEASDAVLQYQGSPQEYIAGNHKIGKNTMAHVAFVDGHVEKIRVDGLTDENLRELTTWLCQGKAVGRNGDKYEELK